MHRETEDVAEHRAAGADGRALERSGEVSQVAAEMLLGDGEADGVREVAGPFEELHPLGDQIGRGAVGSDGLARHRVPKEHERADDRDEHAQGDETRGYPFATTEPPCQPLVGFLDEPDEDERDHDVAHEPAEHVEERHDRGDEQDAEEHRRRMLLVVVVERFGAYRGAPRLVVRLAAGAEIDRQRRGLEQGDLRRYRPLGLTGAGSRGFQLVLGRILGLVALGGHALLRCRARPPSVLP